MKNLKNKKGFTLVELVIVIAILAIIAAIAIPLVSGQITKANDATDASNAQAYTSAIKLAVAQYELNPDQRIEPYKAALGVAGYDATIVPIADIFTWADVKAGTYATKNVKKYFSFDASTNTINVVDTTPTTALSKSTTVNLTK